MNILVACEMSGRVRDAFITKGHNAVSCDLLPSLKPGPHYQGDLSDILNKKLYAFGTQTPYWDMIIAFPPCTHLAVSGARHFAAKRADGRQQEAINFFMRIANADCLRICIENPVGIMSTVWRKPDQIVQPYQFGDPFTKTTCLWLKGLPALVPTSIVDKGERKITKSGKSLPAWYNIPPSDPLRAIKRSMTFSGLAAAMAGQWPG